MKSLSTKKIATIGVLSELGTILAIMIHIPLVPAVSFLTYEPKDVVIVILGFIYGPFATVLSSFVCSLLEILFIGGNVLDLLMNMFSTIGFAGTAAYIYHKNHTKKGALIGLACGMIVTTIVMTIWNYIVTPIYYQMPREAVVAMLLPGIIPFNLIKSGINTAITLYLYKPVVSLLRRTNLVEDSNAAKHDSKSVLVIATFILLTFICIYLAFNNMI